MSKHTPGPYRVSPVSAAIQRSEKDGTRYICTFPYGTTVAQQDEIAALLNKGTRFDEMLDALKAALDLGLGERDFDNSVTLRMKRAIAKAGGTT